MTISVAGRLIQQPAALSDLSRLALAFIDGGVEWLAWALASPSARYDFDDETTLVAQVQQGLHASPFALLPALGLMVSPVKLMTLGLADLQVLARAEGGDTSEVVAVQTRRVLADHRLLVQADLAAVDAWLAELGVAGAPVFQALGFQDRAALCELMRGPTLPGATDASTREAAAFAVQQARTPLEFTDYHRFYLALAAQPAAMTQTPEQRSERATQAMQTLLPLFFGALDCPQTSPLPSPNEVAQAVSAWQGSGKQVGFSRLAEGLQQLVRHTAFNGQTGDAARRLVELYVSSAQSFLATTKPRSGLMGQDGVTCVFPMEAGSQRAELQLGAGGIVSLREYGLQSSPPAPPAPLQTETSP